MKRTALAIILIIVIALSVVAWFFLPQTNTNVPPTNTIIPQTSNSSNATLPTPSPSNIRLPTISPCPPNSTQNPSISNDEAISIATPYINQYATEYNRTVTNVTATFRTGWGKGPVWDVFGGYDRTNITGWQYWIIGYEVVVYVDNGQIAYQQAYGIM
jgi:hypothetical protein